MGQLQEMVIDELEDKNVDLKNRVDELSDSLEALSCYFYDVLFPYLKREISDVEFRHLSIGIKERVDKINL